MSEYSEAKFNSDRNLTESQIARGLKSGDSVSIENAEVGDLVTLSFYTDASPAIVIARTERTITVSEIGHKMDPDFKPEISVGGFCGHCSNQHGQRHIYFPEQTKGSRKLSARRGSKRFKRPENGPGTFASPYNTDRTVSHGCHYFYDYNF